MPELEPHFARVPAPDLPRNPVHIVLDNLRSAYNVGSIFRTSDAGAALHMHLCGMCAHPPHHKLAKTALGADDYVPWTYYKHTTDCVDALHAQGVTVVALEVTPDAIPMPRFIWPQPVAIVFGNEVTGVSEGVLQRCDAVVQIPMHGHKNTINVATAFGVVLYGILAQWDVL